MKKRARRTFTAEYKAEVVRLVRDGGKAVGQVARDLDLTETAVRHWVKQAGIDAGGGGEGALTTVERAELVALRREARQLRMEREILKKVRRPSSRRRASEVWLHPDGEGDLPRATVVPDAFGFDLWVLRLVPTRAE
jgi:transposase